MRCEINLLDELLLEELRIQAGLGFNDADVELEQDEDDPETFRLSIGEDPFGNHKKKDATSTFKRLTKTVEKYGMDHWAVVLEEWWEEGIDFTLTKRENRWSSFTIPEMVEQIRKFLPLIFSGAEFNVKSNGDMVKIDVLKALSPMESNRASSLFALVPKIFPQVVGHHYARLHFFQKTHLIFIRSEEGGSKC